MSRDRSAWLIVVAVAAVFIIAIAAMREPTGGQVEDDDLDTEPTGPSVSVYLEGGTVFAKYSNNGTIIAQSSDASSLLKQAMDVTSIGGELLLGPGTYDLKGEIRVPGGIHIRGDGPDVTVLNGLEHTVLLVQGVSNVSMSAFSTTGSLQIEIMSSLAGTKDIQIMSVTATVDEMASAAFMVGGYGGTISGVSFIDCKALDCKTYGFLNVGDDASYINNISYQGCEASRCGLEGRPNDWVVGFDLAEGVNINGMSVVDCIADNNWESGFHFEKYVDLIDVRLIGCKASNNGIDKENPKYGSGFLLWQDTTLIDCMASGNAIAGYTIKGQNDTVKMINSTVISGSVQNIIPIFPAVIMLLAIRGPLLSWAATSSHSLEQAEEGSLLPHKGHDDDL